MTRLVFDDDADRLPSGAQGNSSGIVPVLLYGRRPPGQGTACVGGPVVPAVRRLGVHAHPLAFDFLTIAMAVTAADTFVDRRQAADGWARELTLEIPLAVPTPWQRVMPTLQAALNFLSGDIWSFTFTDRGPRPPAPQVRGHLTRLEGHDCTSLFSGGLDSAIGVLDLLRSGRRPVLISHSYSGDAKRQGLIRGQLPVEVSQFSAMANPVSKLEGVNDVQMRTRSFNFLAYGTLVAATMAARGFASVPVALHVPENGLIALNPPLTSRRIGSLSTRTTHPHFLALIQNLLTDVGIPVTVETKPYNLLTKGEMLRACGDQSTLRAVAGRTVSCGKWKRSRVQCGRCVPCLIRRSAFHAARMPDTTEYGSAGVDLERVMENEELRDDLAAMLLATRNLSTRNVRTRVMQSGPLPQERIARDALFDVATRGMSEVAAYLEHLGLP